MIFQIYKEKKNFQEFSCAFYEAHIDFKQMQLLIETVYSVIDFIIS